MRSGISTAFAEHQAILEGIRARGPDQAEAAAQLAALGHLGAGEEFAEHAADPSGARAERRARGRLQGPLPSRVEQRAGRRSASPGGPLPSMTRRLGGPGCGGECRAQ